MTHPGLQTNLIEQEITFMHCGLQNSTESRPATPPAGGRAWLLLVALMLSSAWCFAQQGNEKTFASPGAAVLALYNAAKGSDTQTISAIFGSNANDVLRTGDSVADDKRRTDFVTRYDQMHRVVIEPDGTEIGRAHV